MQLADCYIKKKTEKKTCRVYSRTKMLSRDFSASNGKLASGTVGQNKAWEIQETEHASKEHMWPSTLAYKYFFLSLPPGGGVWHRRAELPRRHAGVVRHAADGGGGAHREGDPVHQLALPAAAWRRRQALRHQGLQDDARERSELRQEAQGGDSLPSGSVL